MAFLINKLIYLEEDDGKSARESWWCGTSEFDFQSAIGDAPCLSFSGDRKVLQTVILSNLCTCECVFQDPKLREVLGFGQGDNVEGKLVTVVHGNDLVNISFLNFQAMQEDTAKVTVTREATT